MTASCEAPLRDAPAARGWTPSSRLGVVVESGVAECRPSRLPPLTDSGCHEFLSRTAVAIPAEPQRPLPAGHELAPRLPLRRGAGRAGAAAAASSRLQSLVRGAWPLLRRSAQCPASYRRVLAGREHQRRPTCQLADAAHAVRGDGG